MATEANSPGREQELQTAYLVLLSGGLLGGVLVIAALFTSWWWWAPLLAWLRDGERDKLWQPLLAVFGLLAGLAVMFAAFQAARRFERVDVTLRRVLYGYNAGLTAFLLLLLLVVVNVFMQIRYPLPFDTTEGGFFSLGERTRKFVAELEKPVEVYTLLHPDDERNLGAYQGMKTLLTQMETLNPRYFRFIEVAIDGTNTSTINDLLKRFPKITPRSGGGVLVTLGDKPEANYTFINASELINFDLSDRTNQRRSFNGEVRLMQELFFLAEDKKRPVVYVTQGHGEPEMNDPGPDGMADLVRRLTQSNYDVRPLAATNPDPQKNVVPADADVVLVAGPRRAAGDIIPALEKYVSPTDPAARKGRLVVLLGPTGPDRERGNKMVETGVEKFLRDRFGVNAAGEQILTLAGPGGQPPIRGNQPYPESVFVGPQRGAIDGRHPLALLARDRLTRWEDVRKLEPLPAAAQMRPEAVMQASGFTWLESNMNSRPLETWQRLARDEDEQEKRLDKEPPAVLVTVSESAAPADPHGSGASNKPATPRVVVIGCSTLATNRYMNPRAAGIEFDLVRGSLDWCRERFTQIGVEPKSYRFFALPKQTSYWNLFYLPLAAMALGVFGLGLIVWNTRRS